MSILDQSKTKMNAVIEHHKTELKSIRTGRANTSMLDHVQVEVYGSMMRIKDVASITSPEARQLLITPFDATNKNAIAKAIEKANLGVQPIVDGNNVRIKIAPMDESVRKEMIKLCHKRSEEAKVGVRNVRRDSNEAVKKQKAEGLISEDEVKKLEKQIQDLTDKFCKEVDELTARKETEVSTI
jgi:ribosome recycling factor